MFWSRCCVHIRGVLRDFTSGFWCLLALCLLQRAHYKKSWVTYCVSKSSTSPAIRRVNTVKRLTSVLLDFYSLFFSCKLASVCITEASALPKGHLCRTHRCDQSWPLVNRNPVILKHSCRDKKKKKTNLTDFDAQTKID